MHRKCSRLTRENMVNYKSTIHSRPTQLSKSPNHITASQKALHSCSISNSQKTSKTLLTTLFGSSKMTSSQIKGRNSSLEKKSNPRDSTIDHVRDLEFSRLFESGIKTSALFGSRSTPSITTNKKRQKGLVHS